MIKSPFKRKSNVPLTPKSAARSARGSSASRSVTSLGSVNSLCCDSDDSDDVVFDVVETNLISVTQKIDGETASTRNIYAELELKLNELGSKNNLLELDHTNSSIISIDGSLIDKNHQIDVVEKDEEFSDSDENSDKNSTSQEMNKTMRTTADLEKDDAQSISDEIQIEDEAVAASSTGAKKKTKVHLLGNWNSKHKDVEDVVRSSSLSTKKSVNDILISIKGIKANKKSSPKKVRQSDEKVAKAARKLRSSTSTLSKRASQKSLNPPKKSNKSKWKTRLQNAMVRTKKSKKKLHPVVCRRCSRHIMHPSKSVFDFQKEFNTQALLDFDDYCPCPRSSFSSCGSEPLCIRDHTYCQPIIVSYTLIQTPFNYHNNLSANAHEKKTEFFS